MNVPHDNGIRNDKHDGWKHVACDQNLCHDVSELRKESDDSIEKIVQRDKNVDDILLLSIGLVMVLSASSPSALAESGNSYSYFSRQLIFAVLGIIAMLFISKIDYRFYQKFYKHAWWIALILLALVLGLRLGLLIV